MRWSRLLCRIEAPCPSCSRRRAEGLQQPEREQRERQDDGEENELAVLEARAAQLLEPAQRGVRLTLNTHQGRRAPDAENASDAGYRRAARR